MTEQKIPKGCVYNLLSNATCARGSFRCDRKHKVTTADQDTLRAELDAARAREAACAPYLKDGETPAECIARNRADADGVIELLRQARAREAKLREALSHLVRMVEGERDFCLGNWLPEEYEAVGAARAALAEGEDTPRTEVVEPPIQSVGQEPIKVVNLMEALRRSLDAVCPPVEDK